ncbi:MAG: hypothetical protein VCA36_03650 [Opitutales bacterium]
MKLFRCLKVFSVTVLSVAFVGTFVVYALVPRDALVDYLPHSLGWMLPEPSGESDSATPKEPSPVADEQSSAVGKPTTASVLPRSEPKESAVPDESAESLAPQPDVKEELVEVADQEPDFEDSDVLNKIVAEATNFEKLRVSKRRGVETASDKEGLFTGWAKSVWDKNGQLEELGRYEGGVREGPWVQWQKSGHKRVQGQYKNGRQDGVWIQWKANGVLAKEWTYQDGRKVRLPIKPKLDAGRLRIRERLDARKQFWKERVPRK